MIAESQIRQWLARFLNKEVSLDSFEDWLVQRSWNMHVDSSGAAQKLASAIELRLAEYSSGHLDLAQLRRELLPFVSSYTAEISFGDALQYSFSYSDRIDRIKKWVVVAAVLQSQSVDTLPVVEFG